jgi:transposase
LIACHASTARCLTGHFRPEKGATGNLSSHKNLGAAAGVKGVGAWFVFLSPYSPDLNPVEMAFAKLKALI